MTPPQGEEPAPSEWRVLTIVWELGEAPTRAVVERAQRAHGWSASTTKTLLARLVEKGHLATRQVKNGFVYRAKRRPLSTLRRAGEELLSRAVQGSRAPLLAHLVKKSRLSQAELDELRALLDAQEEEQR